MTMEISLFSCITKLSLTMPCAGKIEWNPRNQRYFSFGYLLCLVILLPLLCCCKSESQIRDEQEEKAIEQKRDSFSRANVQLSFMGMKIGGDIKTIAFAEREKKIKIDSCSNGIYIGTTTIPYTWGDIEEKTNALIRICTFDSTIVTIELLFNDYRAEYFFRETFCKRYYMPENPNFSSTKHEISWIFNTTSIHIHNIFHKEYVLVDVPESKSKPEGDVAIDEREITDNFCIEYRHDILYKKAMSIMKNKKPKKDNNAEKLTEQEQNNIKIKTKRIEYENNI